MPKMTGNYGEESNDRLRQPSSQLREKYELAYRNSSQQQNRSNGSFHAGIVAALTEMAKLDGYELSDLVTINWIFKIMPHAMNSGFMDSPFGAFIGFQTGFFLSKNKDSRP
jgi:hypothetical protein